MLRRRLILPIFASLTICTTLLAQTNYPITIHPSPRQTLQCFGASQVAMEFGHFPPEPQRSEMADLVYRDLKAGA